MTRPAEAVISAAKASASNMADRDTPFVFDEWYVGARSSEIGRAVLPRTLLGKQVVLYRTLEGQVVALDGRCVHRSYPLSAGTLDDDNDGRYAVRRHVVPTTLPPVWADRRLERRLRVVRRSEALRMHVGEMRQIEEILMQAQIVAVQARANRDFDIRSAGSA